MVNDLSRFTILQFGDVYHIQKICSITKELYQVQLTTPQFRSYYTPWGKKIDHLEGLLLEDLNFLKSTLTPEEIKLLDLKTLELHPKFWRSELKKKLLKNKKKNDNKRNITTSSNSK